jgi:acetyltransferase EpsM
MAGLKKPEGNPLIVLGTSGFALELGDLLLAAGYKLKGFVGPEPELCLPASWLGRDDVLTNLPRPLEALVAVGAPSLRLKLIEKAERLEIQLNSFVHPSAHVSVRAEIGKGSIVYPNATVHAGVRLGKGVLVNSNATIGHETRLDDFSNIGPGVAIGGRCEIGARAYIGIGASIIELIRVTEGVVLGAGATLACHADIPGTYVGVPAKRLGN